MRERCFSPTCGRTGELSSPEIIFMPQSGETVTLLKRKEQQDLPEFKVKSHLVDVPS